MKLIGCTRTRVIIGITHAVTDDLQAEMIAPKVFLSRSNVYLIKKSLEKLILSSNENKALINNLIDLVQFLTMNSTEKALSLSLSMKTQNVIMNISKIKIVMAVIKLKNS